MTALVAVLVSVAACAAAIRIAWGYRARAKLAEAEVKTITAKYERVYGLYQKAEELRHELQKDLERLRAGTPSARLGASLDLLRDVSARTGAGAEPAADSVADTSKP